MTDAFPYVSNTSIEELAARIRTAKRIFVTTHAKPDGDALGSVLAVVRAAQALGIHAEGWMVGPFEPNLMSLAAPTALECVDPKAPRLPTTEYDLIVIVDTGAWSQLETLAPWLRARVANAIGIDHHTRGDEVARQRVIDVTCGSATAIIARLIDALHVPLHAPLSSPTDRKGRGSIAEALFLGLATDTGWFRFQNAKPAEFELASRLLAAGVDKDRLVETVENSHRPERLVIEALALGGVTFVDLGTRGSVAVMRIAMSDLQKTAATVEETSGIVNAPMAIGAVRAAVLLVETEPGLVKLSFRSKPRDDDGRFIDVNELASRFDGGGHVHAAGARFRGTLPDAERAVSAAIVEPIVAT